MVQLPAEPVLLRDLPNDAMYIGREWFEYMLAQHHELDALRANLRAILRDFPITVPADEIRKLRLDR